MSFVFGPIFGLLIVKVRNIQIRVGSGSGDSYSYFYFLVSSSYPISNKSILLSQLTFFHFWYPATFQLTKLQTTNTTLRIASGDSNHSILSSWKRFIRLTNKTHLSDIFQRITNEWMEVQYLLQAGGSNVHRDLFRPHLVKIELTAIDLPLPQLN